METFLCIFSEKAQWWWDFDGDDISGGLRMDLTFFGGERICDEENLSGSGPVCFASWGYIITTNTIIIILNIIITFKVTLVEPISTGPQWRSWSITENLTQTSWDGAGETVGGDVDTCGDAGDDEVTNTIHVSEFLSKH